MLILEYSSDQQECRLKTKKSSGICLHFPELISRAVYRLFSSSHPYYSKLSRGEGRASIIITWRSCSTTSGALINPNHHHQGYHTGTFIASFRACRLAQDRSY
jgi:hypothetical protein